MPDGARRKPRVAIAAQDERPQPSVVELEAQIAALTAELREAREEQAATADVLQVINSSPGDLAPVFDTMLEKALRLCEADEALVRTFDGAALHLAAAHGDADGVAKVRALGASSLTGLYEPFARGERVVHIPDVRESDAFRNSAVGRARLEARRIRTWLAVALHKDDVLLGIINVHRHEVRPFSDRQIALLQSFAAQAVVAMENARLLTETREALERQTATAEILRVISSSPTDVQPTFEAIAKAAARVSGAASATVHPFDGSLIHTGAVHGYRPGGLEAVASVFPMPPSRGTATGRAILTGDTIHIVDPAADPDFAHARLSQFGTALSVPMLKDGNPLGAITASRQKIEAFTQPQIDLLKTFADQAVIAIENVRLFNELNQRTRDLSESLEYQTATSEVLNVISRSTADVQPVLDTVAETAARLCGADVATVAIRKGEVYRYVSGSLSLAEPEWWETLRQRTIVPGRDSVAGRVALEGRVVHVADILADPDYAVPETVAAGRRTGLGVPLLREGAVLGTINLSRKRVEPFTERQIELVRTFADQAVIAMENARLLGELRARTAELAERNAAFAERIDHQAATIDVLKEMSASPANAQPVFDLICDQARALLGAPSVALFEYDGTLVHRRTRSRTALLADDPTAWAAYDAGWPRVPDRGSLSCRAILDGKMVHIRDMDAEPGVSEEVRALGNKTQVSIPLLRDGRAIGAITTTTPRVDGISDTQIELLNTFAEQAVIAIQSAETWRELQARTRDLEESLEYQTATSEVLNVISRSTADVQPVLDTVAETAARLCDADLAAVTIRDGEVYRYVSMSTSATEPEFWSILRARKIVPGRDSTVGRVLLEGNVVHIEDIRTEPYSAHREAVAAGRRTVLGVPLLREGAVLGTISLARKRVEPFTERQIELIRTFADQAVIAMENARLLAELHESLDQQTATAEVLQVINSSPGDLKPVFDAVLKRAMGLCEAKFGRFHTIDGEGLLHLGAEQGIPPLYAEYTANPANRPGPGGATPRLMRDPTLPFVHVIDLKEEEAYRSGDPYRHALVHLGGVRTLLAIPLRKDGVMWGVINIYRQEVRPYSDKEIALLESFAAQAVIAMENARLLGELQARTRDLEESLEYQTATSDVLNVISRSTADVQPVLDTAIETAVRLCGADTGAITIRDGEVYRYVSSSYSAAEPEHWASMRQRTIVPGRNSVHARVALEGRVVHVEDIRADPDYAWPGVVESGRRSMLGVPLLREGAVLGTIVLSRKRVEPFAERQIELVRTFADQAVIAIENARLLTELQARTHDLEESLEYQTATSDVLNVISRSTADVQPVLDTVAETAARLCDSDTAYITLREGEGYRAVANNYVSAVDAELWAALRQRTTFPGRQSVTGRVALEGKIVHVADILADPEYAIPEARSSGRRTILGVPLLRDGVVLGTINLARKRVEPFTDRQIELVRTFADQAVIAIENARLITETREALEQQTAAAEVLQVINSSPGDLAPVFRTILDKAHALCGATLGTLFLFDGETFRAAATHGYPPEVVERLRRGINPHADTAAFAPLLQGERLLHHADLRELDDPLARAVSGPGGVRTNLLLPLRKDATLLGLISCNRIEVRPFTEKEIALLESFAAQAVIAMENARLLSELRESLEQQQAMAEVLGVINANPGNLQPVFDVILEKAHSLGGASRGRLFLLDGEFFRSAASQGYPEGPQGPPPAIPIAQDPRAAALVAGERLIHVPDLTALDDPIARAVAKRGGVRTNLMLPLRREGTILGFLSCNRAEVRPFTEKEIALLESFAAQAVIAMDNARLLSEIRQRQAELRVTFDSMGDGVAMFDAEMRLAAWNMNFQKILDLPDEFVEARPSLQGYFQYMSARGEYGSASAQLEAEIRRGVSDAGHESRFERTRPDGRVIEVRRNAVPGGGSVLIFSDITERKRAEAEIRQARDAAERALRELKAMQANLIQAEKMASLGQLTAGIAHEIKNPLNFVNNFAGLSVELLDELKQIAAPGFEALQEDARADLDETVELLTGNLGKIAEHGRRADNIVKSMLEHSRGASGERRPVDLNGLVEEALNLAYHGARAQDQNFNITLERDFAESIAPVELVPQDVTRVFLNLFGNGFYAANKRRRQDADAAFKPTLKVTTREVADAVEILVRDNGTGIPAEVRDKLFQPFFTTKPTGEGTGLGLSISYDIVTQQHGGAIAVDSRLGEFTEFTVRLPRSHPASQAA